MPLAEMPRQVLEWQKTHVGLSVSTSGPRWKRVSIVHSGLLRNVCRAVTSDYRGHATMLEKRQGGEIIIRNSPAGFERRLTALTSLFCRGGIFSFPVTYPTWWFASLPCVITHRNLAGFPFPKVGALLQIICFLCVVSEINNFFVVVAVV